jgi:hypothetical protein
MASSEAQKPKRFRRRFIRLAVFIVVLFGGYSIGWSFLANWLETRAAEAIARLNNGETSAECSNPTARGYPFRIGLYCDRVAFARPGRGVGMTAGAFRSAAQVYDPLRLVGELDGPMTVEAPGVGAIQLGWEALRASARLWRPLPERVSVEGRKLAAGRSPETPMVMAEAFEGHMRSNGADIDLAGSMSGVTIDPSLLKGRTLPPLAGRSDFTLNDGARMILERARTLRGSSFTIRELSLSAGTDASVSLSGTAAIAENGLLDADLVVKLKSPGELLQIATDALPEASQQIATASGVVSALGPEPTLPLKIVKGRIRMGFFTLGEIPPL